MLFPTAGSRLFISDAPSDRNGVLPAAGWVEIGEVEALGTLGVDWSTAEAEYVGDCDGIEGGYIETAKQSRRASPMQIVMANNPGDPGQAILWKAAKSTEHYPFRLIFPGEGPSRRWLALVTTLAEAFDTANAIMKLQAVLIPTHNIQRSEA